ncbi:hypothetical protein Sjap_003712 [Stephania japonica]|uniref:Pectinesterase n=1 Tax=Stephania japonica TaxID=461633 RepID=A0AAP0PTV4_9MAGN
MATSFKGISLIFISILAALIAAQFIAPNSAYPRYLIDDLISVVTLSPIASKLIPFEIGSSCCRRRHHHHNRHDDNKQKVSICDSFRHDLVPPATNATSVFCVDHNGCCNFTTVQAAVDAVETLSQKRNIIWINQGIYFEKVMVPKTKQNITFQGQGFESTAIVYNDNANSSHGTFYSGSVQVFSNNFIAKNISFMNVAPMPGPGVVGAQAVAMRISGDQAAFWGCGFFGAQDTLHDDRGRHYFKECFIQGSIDFIFGNGKSLYESFSDEDSGFSFVNCTIGGTGRIWLGRAWRPFSRVVYAFTSMTDIIAPEGWNDLNDPTRDQSIFYGEYKCSGAGANATMRVPYAQILNDTQAASFLNTSFINADIWLQPL